MADPSAAPADPAHAVIGRTIAGKFRVVSYLGGGAVGAVYKARQLALDKDVAIKLLHGEHAQDAMFAARFEREAKAASKLDHPNSMRVLDFGVEPDGLAYIAMEYLDGRHLLDVMGADWPLAPARVADIVSQALAAVSAANATGIVHRDLKPENIMILRGTDDEGTPRDVVKVCDFGIAKFIEERGAPITGQEKLTSHGIVVGTPEYMSPEQCRGEPLDVRSDLYAMGVILYQLLTRRVPFEADTALGIVLKHINDDADPPRALNPLADERLEAICLKAMQKKRERRYQTAREMRADLRGIAGTWAPEPLSQSSPSLDRRVLAPVKPTQRWLARQPPAEDLEPVDAPRLEPSVIVTPEPASAPVIDPPAIDPPAAGLSSTDPGRRAPDRTQRMRSREDGPSGTRRLKARDAGITRTRRMTAREELGPTGTVLLEPRAGGGVARRPPAWLIALAVVVALALLAVVWALARAMTSP